VVSSRTPGDRQIAVMAGEELVGALRLAGVRMVKVIRADPAAANAVRRTLQDWVGQEEIGVIVVAEELAALARELIDSLRAQRRIFPVILEVSSPENARHADVAAYYRKLSRDFLGLEIVLQEPQASAAARDAGPA
jgi:vacuolar-type H+-ATPase subunit F/Vma7